MEGGSPRPNATAFDWYLPIHGKSVVWEKMKTFQNIFSRACPVRGWMVKTCFNSVTVNDFLPLWRKGRGRGVGPGPFFHTGVGNKFEMPHPLVFILVNSVYIQQILAGTNFV
jgi:hypothetical protein